MSSSEWFKFNPVFNSKWAITQGSLKELLGLKDRAEKFIKVAEVAFYSYDQLPTKYKDIVWKQDNATYTEEQLKIYDFRLEEIEENLKELRKKVAILKAKAIKVLERVYPGVSVGITDVVYVIPEEKQGPLKFYLEASIIQTASVKD